MTRDYYLRHLSAHLSTLVQVFDQDNRDFDKCVEHVRHLTLRFQTENKLPILTEPDNDDDL